MSSKPEKNLLKKSNDRIFINWNTFSFGHFLQTRKNYPSAHAEAYQADWPVALGEVCVGVA